MVIGRSIVGAAVGAASFVAPLYIAELAPAAHRGRLVTLTVVFITLGQVAAYVVGWLCGMYGSKETAWRWMVGLGALPAVVQLFLLVLMPETPRWLAKVGRSTDARSVIQKSSGSTASPRQIDAILKNIEIEIREEEEARKFRGRSTSLGFELPDSLHELLSVRRNRRALAIACLLQGLQQLCGFVGADEPTTADGRSADSLYRTHSCTFQPPFSAFWDSPYLPSPPSSLQPPISASLWLPSYSSTR